MEAKQVTLTTDRIQRPIVVAALVLGNLLTFPLLFLLFRLLMNL